MDIGEGWLASSCWQAELYSQYAAEDRLLSVPEFFELYKELTQG